MRKSEKLPTGPKAPVSKRGLIQRSRMRTCVTILENHSTAFTLLVTVTFAVVTRSWQVVTFFYPQRPSVPPPIVTATNHSNAAGRDINLFGLDEEKAKRAFAELHERLSKIQTDVARAVSKTDTPAIAEPSFSPTLSSGSSSPLIDALSSAYKPIDVPPLTSTWSSLLNVSAPATDLLSAYKIDAPVTDLSSAYKPIDVPPLTPTWSSLLNVSAPATDLLSAYKPVDVPPLTSIWSSLLNVSSSPFKIDASGNIDLLSPTYKPIDVPPLSQTLLSGGALPSLGNTDTSLTRVPAALASFGSSSALPR